MLPAVAARSPPNELLTCALPEMGKRPGGCEQISECQKMSSDEDAVVLFVEACSQKGRLAH